MDSLPLTLQITVSPGDIAYAPLTVPRLIAAHRDEVESVVLVVDCCRPQPSKFFNPQTRLPPETFLSRLERIQEIAAVLQKGGAVDRVEYLHPNDSRITELAGRFTAGAVQATHDCGGCGFMSYLLGLECVDTPYVLHYDADMLLYQAGGYSWASAALEALRSDTRLLSVTPRIAPPLDSDNALSLHEQRPLTSHPQGFVSDWFSTRCFLIDRARLHAALPLVSGVSLYRMHCARLLHSLLPVPGRTPETGEAGTLEKLYWQAFPAYPRSPEILFHRHFPRHNLYTLHLDDRRAFLLHPVEKNEAFLSQLPDIQAAMQKNRIPHDQKGHADIKLTCWINQGSR